MLSQTTRGVDIFRAAQACSLESKDLAEPKVNAQVYRAMEAYYEAYYHAMARCFDYGEYASARHDTDS
jgi:hypothetical protein